MTDEVKEMADFLKKNMDDRREEVLKADRGSLPRFKISEGELYNKMREHYAEMAKQTIWTDVIDAEVIKPKLLKIK